ncbi:hypothetical protein ACXWN7_09880, partial [Streptococcus pyogenes]
MMDADIADTTVISQPKALNQKRIKNGKLPLCDYRVVDLSVRHRRKAIPGEPTGRKVRCHFRRGHWMHADAQPIADASRHAVAQR